MPKNLKLPVGIDSFEKIRREGFYYVDKTLLIEQLLDQWSEVNLFTRPRRFGKTLNMSMLKYFFEIGADKTLFAGLNISKNEKLCEEYQGKYPVIFLSLKGVDGLSFHEAVDNLKMQIGREAKRFSFLLRSEHLEEDEKQLYRSLIELRDGQYAMGNVPLQSSLQTLSQLLHKHYGKKAIILIDEYDVPLDKAFHHGYYREMVALIRGLFGNALKTNESLQFAVLTGCPNEKIREVFKNQVQEWFKSTMLKDSDGLQGFWSAFENGDAGIVIELKIVDRLNELEGACQKAMDQIRDRGYDAYFRNEGCDNIRAYGIAFYKKRCRVITEKT